MSSAETVRRETVHVYPVRVFYEDTDAGGVVYHANYLKFAERARTEMLRDAGVGHTELSRDHGVYFAVRHCAIDYLKPARLDDALEVRTRLLELGGASAWAEQIVARDGDDLARMKLRLACINGAGRPARFPAPVQRALASYSDFSDASASQR